MFLKKRMRFMLAAFQILKIIIKYIVLYMPTDKLYTKCFYGPFGKLGVWHAVHAHYTNICHLHTSESQVPFFKMGPSTLSQKIRLKITLLFKLPY